MDLLLCFFFYNFVILFTNVTPQNPKIKKNKKDILPPGVFSGSSRFGPKFYFFQTSETESDEEEDESDSIDEKMQV